MTGDDEPATRDHPDELAPETPTVTAGGLSLSLPYVPGRLVIEISEPAASAGQIAPGDAYADSAGGQLALVQELPRHGQRDSSA